MLNTKVFTEIGLNKARQILQAVPVSHRNLLLDSFRSTSKAPRQLEAGETNASH